MDDPRELITHEPFSPREDRVQDALPDSRSPYPAERDRYENDDPYDIRRFRRNTPLAGRGARLGAYLLDVFLTFLAALPGIILAFALASNFRGADEDTVILLVIGVGGAGVFALLVFQWYLLATQGQTLGKKALGIRIVHFEDESNPGFVGTVILRQWVPALIAQIPLVGGIFGLVNILCIFGEERRCLHDQIAGTKVILAR